MSLGMRIGEWLDDRLNPIVVKELRQAVRSRILAGLLMLFLLVLLLAMGAVVGEQSYSSRVYLNQTSNMGREAFEVLFGILVVSTMMIVPAYTGIRMALERSEDGMDLLFVSALTPGAIIRGKLYAGWVITLLFYCVSMPFMTFTYFLRGIDIPSILIIMGMAFLGVTGAIQFALSMGCTASGRLAKFITGAIALSFIIGCCTFIIESGDNLIRSGIGSRIGSRYFWERAGLAVALTGLVTGLFYAVATSEISPRSSNRAMPVRIYLTTVWVLSGMAVFAFSSKPRLDDSMEIWFGISVIILSFGYLGAVCERDRISLRVASAIPEALWKRMLSYPFFSGPLNGIVWILVLTALSFTVYGWADGELKFTEHREETDFLGIALYSYCYALTGLYIHRSFLSEWVRTRYTWMIAAGVVAAACFIPFFQLIIAGESFSENPMLGNMFDFLFNNEHCAAHFTLCGIWIFVITFLNLKWIIRQAGAFRAPGGK